MVEIGSGIPQSDISPPDLDNNKHAFAVAFLTSAVAVFAFKEQLKGVVLNFHFARWDVYNASLVFVSLLGLSSYFFALSMISFRSYGKFMNKIADFLYAAGMLYPLGTIVVWIFMQAISTLKPSQKKIQILGSLLAVASGLIVSFLATRIESKSLKESRQKLIYTLRDGYPMYYKFSKESFREGDFIASYRYSLSSIREAIWVILLTKKGKYSDSTIEALVKDSVKYGLLTEEKASKIMSAAEKINTALEISKRDAQALLRLGREIIKSVPISDKG